jgi:hypothetical protein
MQEEGLARQNAELLRELADMRRQLAQLEVSTNGGVCVFPAFPNVVIEKQIAKSSQATVYKGTFEGVAVAVKVFENSHGSGDDYLKELRSLVYGSDTPARDAMTLSLTHAHTHTHTRDAHAGG